jgi:hypothetical protein
MFSNTKESDRKRNLDNLIILKQKKSTPRGPTDSPPDTPDKGGMLITGEASLLTRTCLLLFSGMLKQLVSSG